jgi:hypothetical protein
MHWSGFKGIGITNTPIHPAMLSPKGYIKEIKGIWIKGSDCHNDQSNTYNVVFDSDFVEAKLRAFFKSFLLPGVSATYKQRLLKLITQILNDE